MAAVWSITAIDGAEVCAATGPDRCVGDYWGGEREKGRCREKRKEGQGLRKRDEERERDGERDRQV